MSAHIPARLIGECPLFTLLAKRTALLVALLSALLTALPLRADITGTVVNETTGEPAGRVALTLIRFDQGMDPVAEVYSNPDGTFSFTKSLTNAGGQPVPGMVRAEFEGVGYSLMLPPGRPAENVRVSVFAVTEASPQPDDHIIIVEPGAGEMIINETFVFKNQSAPPKTFRNPAKGTLRFYLPAEAKDFVRITVSGPAQMPMPSTSTPTSQPNVRMIDFPIKPGENRVDLTYLVPHKDGAPFTSKVVYPGLRTRLAAPAGVTVSAEGLVSMGQEPQTQATVYELAAGQEFTLMVSGQGRLSRGSAETGAAGGGGGGSLEIKPAPVASELYWIIALTCAILGVGFYSLLGAKSGVADVAPPSGKR